MENAPRIAVVLTEGYADWECAYLNGAGRLFYGLNPRIVTPGGRSVVSQGGLMTLPGEPLDIVSPETFQILVLCGGAGWDENEFADVTAAAGKFLDAGRTVAAICGATLGLAKAGLLDNRAHTSNSLSYLKSKAEAYRGESFYRDVTDAVVDRGLITAPGNAPARFTGEIFRAAGVADRDVREFIAMLAAEHAPAPAENARAAVGR